MSSQSLYKVSGNIAANALVNNDKYKTMYQESIVNPEGFWREHGKRIDWIKPYTKIKKPLLMTIIYRSIGFTMAP